MKYYFPTKLRQVLVHTIWVEIKGIMLSGKSKPQRSHRPGHLAQELSCQLRHQCPVSECLGSVPSSAPPSSFKQTQTLGESSDGSDTWIPVMHIGPGMSSWLPALVYLVPIPAAPGMEGVNQQIGAQSLKHTQTGSGKVMNVHN